MVNIQASTDQTAVDLTISNAVGVFVFAVVQILAVIAIMSQISWQVLLVFIPVIAICVWLQVCHINFSTDNNHMYDNYVKFYLFLVAILRVFSTRVSTTGGSVQSPDHTTFLRNLVRFNNHQEL